MTPEVVYRGGVNVEVTPLPGIGVRKDFALRDGRRIGVISYRDGKLELIISKTDDPDACVAGSSGTTLVPSSSPGSALATSAANCCSAIISATGRRSVS